jgi:Phage integrase family
VRGGKGGKDRVLMLPQTLAQALRDQIAGARLLWSDDAASKRGGVAMPHALDRKYPRAGTSWPWFWVLPQATLSTDPRSGVVRRHHLCDQTFQRAFKRAAQAASSAKPESPQTRRTRCAIALPRTCCNRAMTSALCKICWAMPMWRPR